MHYVHRLLSHIHGVNPTERIAQYSRLNRSFPEADKWALSEFIHTKLVSVVGVRLFPFDELLMMTATAAYFQPELIVEWDTHIFKQKIAQEYGRRFSLRILIEAGTFVGDMVEANKTMFERICSIELDEVTRHARNFLLSYL